MRRLLEVVAVEMVVAVEVVVHLAWTTGAFGESTTMKAT